MFDELGIGDVIDQATHQNPEMRDLTVGEAVKAMVLNGLGFINQALYLVPRFFQHKPTSRLISLRVTPEQLNDDALGRALERVLEFSPASLLTPRAITLSTLATVPLSFYYDRRVSMHIYTPVGAQHSQRTSSKGETSVCRARQRMLQSSIPVT